MNQDNIVTKIATWLVPLVIAIVFHEVAHGLVARRLGDPTAEQRGRLSLNPLKHVDPFGTVILPLFLAVANVGAIFGWAKPVPVNYARLRNPRRDMILVALAGPGMNLLLAIVGALILAATLSVSGGGEDPAAEFIARNALNFVSINVFLAVFNLIPLPPFDGGHVAEGLLPPPLAAKFRQIGRYSLLVFVMLLLVLPRLSPQLDVIGRVVAPLVRAIVLGLIGLVGTVV